jgi:hypothetical protein
MHQAPEALIAAAARAERDEIRHTEIMSRCARHFGGLPSLPSPGPYAVRPLFEIALENAVEGCVRETYGALVAWLQLAQAADPYIQAAMGPIARDETDHAWLAFAVAQWMNGQLDEEARRAVRKAQMEAAARLSMEVGVDPPAALLHSAGLPAACVASQLVAEAQSLLWS